MTELQLNLHSLPIDILSRIYDINAKEELDLINPQIEMLYDKLQELIMNHSLIGKLFYSYLINIMLKWREQPIYETYDIFKFNAKSIEYCIKKDKKMIQITKTLFELKNEKLLLERKTKTTYLKLIVNISQKITQKINDKLFNFTKLVNENKDDIQDIISPYLDEFDDIEDNDEYALYEVLDFINNL